MIPNITKEVFTVSDLKHSESRNGEQMITLELSDIVNDDVYETYVVEDHKNYKHWERIIENPDRFYFLGNLKLKEVRGADWPIDEKNGLLSRDVAEAVVV